MFWVKVGSLMMFLAVALGAFGAHGLKNRVTPDLMVIFETGVKYHVYHALALFIVAWLSDRNPLAWTEVAGWSFLIGIIIFSGSLYVMSLTGLRWLGMITPMGGLAFLVGWAALFFGYLKKA